MEGTENSEEAVSTPITGYGVAKVVDSRHPNFKDFLVACRDYPHARHLCAKFPFSSTAHESRCDLAGDEAVVKLILQTRIDMSDTDVEGNSTLHWSIKASKVSCPEHIRILVLLLKHGARVNQKDKLGLTAVHIAAANGNLEALKILLNHDPDSFRDTSKLKETPIFYAAKNDFIECAQLLLSCGATTDVYNLRREKPMDLAKSQPCY